MDGSERNSLDKTILHITPHLGGGVGSVISDYIIYSSVNNSFLHSIAVLDTPKTAISDSLRASLHSYIINISNLLPSEIQGLLFSFDLIIFHYWNHPLASQFLLTHRTPSEKLILWCHTSGIQAPYLNSPFFLNLGSHIIYTSHLSTLSKQSARILRPAAIIPSVRNLKPFTSLRSQRRFTQSSPRRNLLYIGTLSQSKLHPQAYELFSNLINLGFIITVIGDLTGSELDLQFSDSQKRFIRFLGYQPSIKQYLIDADIFLYPLNPSHYGTGEQVLGEAMASGLPVVVLDNPCETEILGDCLSHCIGSDISSLVSVINTLSSDDSLYRSTSQLSYARAAERYSIEIMTCSLSAVFNTYTPIYNVSMPMLANHMCTTFSLPLTACLMASLPADSIYYIYRQAVGHRNNALKLAASIYKENIDHDYLSSPSKGSLLQYLEYFTESPELLSFYTLVNA